MAGWGAPHIPASNAIGQVPGQVPVLLPVLEASQRFPEMTRPLSTVLFIHSQL